MRYLALLFLFFGTVESAAQTEKLTGLQAIGAPFASYNQGEGIAVGLGLLLYNYGDGSISPYNWNIYFDARASNKGKQSYKMRANAPHIFNTPLRLFVDVGYKKIIHEDYFGIGNRTAYHPQYTEDDHEAYITTDYYSYFSKSVYMIFDFQLALKKSFIICGVGIQQQKNKLYDEAANKLALDSPYGIKGGQSNFYRFGWVWDTRDNEAAPKKGVWSEILFQHHASILQSDYDFKRITFADRRYYSLGERFVFAQRVLAEHGLDDIPFYEMMQIYTYSKQMKGLGGSDTMRGIPRLLYIGTSKLVANFELRFELFQIKLLRQPFTVFTHLFADAGKVWLPQDSFDLKHLHLSQGLGIHVLWKKDAVFFLDVGRSPLLDKAIYIGFGNLF